MKTMTTLVSALAISAMAGTASAADFATLDANADGQVSFDEYRTVALAKGKTSTLAASEFTKMTQGDAILTEAEFLLAESDAAERTEADLYAAPLTENSVETVAPVGTFESFPADAQAIEIETDTAVAGEVTTSDGMMILDPVEPIVETPTLDPDVQTEPEIETGIETGIETSDDIDIPEAPELPEESGEIY